ncbi:MAG: polysaccharide biosynthesis tyrosine autokinase [Paludibacteraceae bacterium]|nr:polysaccharide biosynthesis tyrosine autokinase [Paludibacteraceae bacterium]
MEAQENNMIDVKSIILLVLKKWYWFMLSCVVCGGLGILYYFSTSQSFAVDSEVLFRSGDEGVSIPGADMLQMFGIGGSKKIDDELEMMTSRDIVMQVIKKLDLQTVYAVKHGLRWEDQYAGQCDLHVEYPPMFLDTMKAGVQIKLKVRKEDYVVKVKTKRFHTEKFVVSNLAEPLQTEIGPVRIEVLKPLEKGARYTISTGSLLGVAKNYIKSFMVSKLKKESAIVKISTTTTRPQLAIDFINAQIEIYNEESVIDKKLKANTTAVFIGDRLELIARELQTAEEDVEQYMQDNNLTNFETDLQIYLAESTEYRHQIEALETQMKLVSYVENIVKDDKNKDQLIPANLGIQDESLAQLINQYDDILLRRMRMDRTATGTNPVVQQMNDQLSLMRANILTSIQSVKHSLRISKDDLESRSRESNKQLADAPTKTRQYVEKVRNKELQQKLYLYLYQKREENALSLVAAVPPADIVVRPQVDPKPVAPRLRYVGLFCLILGLGIPAAVLYLMSLLNTKILDRKQYERRLKVPYVGELLNYPEGGSIVVGDGLDSTAAELFRLLRTNILHAFSDKKQKVILVSSSINDEGKSYISSNIAMSLALLGKRVALVELDLRNPSLAENFGVSNNRGVTSYLNGSEIAIEDLLLPSGHNKNLDILPAGATPMNPNELLQSDQLDQLFAVLRKNYDYVVVDSAPAAMVSDTFVVNRVCDLTLYVARVDVTTNDMVDFANAIAEQQRLNNMLAVLNAVGREDLPYGHAYGYHKQ